MIRLQITVQGGALVMQKSRLKAVMRAAGREVAAVAKRLASQDGGGRLYYGPGGSAAKYRGGYVKGRYRASKAGSAPARITGTLAGSFVVLPFADGEGVAIRDTAFYSRFLETGAKGGGRRSKSGARVRGKGGIGKTRVLAPRPFLTSALEQRSQSIAPRIRQAIIDDIKFVRVKP